ncbi:MAG: serine--tRNA ligase [Planctomycetota bacterium]
MLDVDLIRQQPDRVQQAAKNKGEEVDVAGFLALDEERRDLIRQAEELRRRRNANSDRVAELKRAGEDADALIEETREISEEIKQVEKVLSGVQERFDQAALTFPNIPRDDVPVGRDESDNVEIKHEGDRAQFDFEPKPHWDIVKDLDIIDFDAATGIAGPFFALYKGAGARLERALVQFMLDLHTREHGYTEVSTPFVANRAATTGTGQLPKLEDDMYLCERDDLFLIPTAEVPVTNIHRDQVLDADDLPIRYTAYSPCFRREAGSYGRDTRGLMRIHQFDKVELVNFVRPDTSWDRLETLLGEAEEVLRRLGIEYRVLELCTGELSFAAARCYDIEIWAPGIERWLEISSCSNFTDFQARRAGIRFREKGGKPEFVHTLNGSGVALARLVLTIIEQYQTADGCVRVPDALRPYIGGLERIGGDGR